MPEPQVPWRFRAVAFDLDGLLIDTEPLFRETMRAVLERRKIRFDPSFMHSMMGVPAAQSLPRMRERFGLCESVPELAEECKETFLTLLGDGRAPLMPGVPALLDWLQRRDVPLAIVTSSGRPFVNHVFGPHGLLDRFRFVLTSDDVSNGKPHPDVYLLAAKRFGVSSPEMIVLEDSPNGLRAAKAAGARCIVVPHQHTDRDDLHEADAVVPSLESPEFRRLIGWID